MSKVLTSPEFWHKYWESRHIDKLINRYYGFYEIFQKELAGYRYKTMIEIGGFPGYFSIYFRKYWNYRTAFLDYVTNKEIVKELLKTNGLTLKDIQIIKSDFTKYRRSKKYDVVFSLGFVEHFEEPEKIIKLHWKMVKKGGKMIVLIPNFLGINGFYQLLFDPANLNIHNLNAMDMSSLRKIVKNFHPKKSQIFYVSSGLVWLENIDDRKKSFRLFNSVLNILGSMLIKFGLKGRFISSHIAIVAEK